MTPLATRVTTAAVLVPVVLLALFVLPPLGWAAFVLVVVGVGAVEWTKLAGFRAPWRSLFAGAVVLACLALLYVPPPGDGYWDEQTLADTQSRYPGADLPPYR